MRRKSSQVDQNCAGMPIRGEDPEKIRTSGPKRPKTPRTKDDRTTTCQGPHLLTGLSRRKVGSESGHVSGPGLGWTRVVEMPKEAAAFVHVSCT
ncbi:hypothetical protein MTP99_016599 [Tenebrio molitor]|nr:hypothetical protein MTP99_016599 [Tenebrio molitor]